MRSCCIINAAVLKLSVCLCMCDSNQVYCICEYSVSEQVGVVSIMFHSQLDPELCGRVGPSALYSLS